jgi:hypothetical protein
LTDQDEKLFERQYFRREFFSFPSMLRSTENRLSGMNFRGGISLVTFLLLETRKSLAFRAK